MALSIFPLVISFLMSLVFGVLMILAIGVGMLFWYQVKAPAEPPAIVHPAEPAAPALTPPRPPQAGLV